MSTEKINVVFTVVPAEVVSTIAAADGYVMKGYLVTGVKIGNDEPMMFTPRKNDEWTRTGATVQRDYELPARMARRLGEFVNTCFVHPSVPDGPSFDGGSFMKYLCERSDTPFGEPSDEGSDVDYIGPEGLIIGTPFVGATAEDEVATSGISLGGPLALAVTGIDSSLSICDLEALLMAYGGVTAYEVVLQA